MESSEEDTDWEQIRHPFDPHPPSPPPQGAPFENELLIRDNFFDDDNSSLFPPSEHEDLPLEGQNSHSPSPPFSSTCSDVSTPMGNQMRRASDSNSSFFIMINEIGIRISTIGKKMFQAIPFGGSRKFSVILSSALAMVALFACVKILQWRKRLLLLVREKDQRISQLMNQIAYMNEILSARRKVPVLLLYS